MFPDVIFLHVLLLSAPFDPQCFSVPSKYADVLSSGAVWHLSHVTVVTLPLSRQHLEAEPLLEINLTE